MNDPFLESTNSEKYATIMLALGKYIQLLIFPHPLTYDYYPKHIPIVSWGNSLVMLSVLSYLLLIVVSIWGFFKRHISAFGILLFFITLSIASNLVFPIGAFMNERFIYVSSLGFCLILGYYLLFGLPKFIEHQKKAKKAFTIISILIFSLYSIKTVSRNWVWKDNLTLSTNDAKISINGAKSNVMAGGLLSEEAVKTKNPKVKQELLQESIYHLNRALEIYPEYTDALILMGNAQWELTKDAKNSIPYYQKILSINPEHSNTWQNIFVILEQTKDVDYKIKAYETLMRYNGGKAKLYVNLGRAYGQGKNNLNKALEVFNQGLQVAPNSYQLHSNLGTVYGLQGNYPAAIQVLEKATQLKPNIAKTYVDLGLSYFYSGQKEKAKSAFDQALKLDPEIDRNQFPI
jgi:tetratricopeptide (TPR) repeat protein